VAPAKGDGQRVSFRSFSVIVLKRVQLFIVIIILSFSFFVAFLIFEGLEILWFLFLKNPPSENGAWRMTLTQTTTFSIYNQNPYLKEEDEEINNKLPRPLTT